MILQTYASNLDYFNIFIVSLIMMIISILFSKKFGLSMKEQMELQQKLRDLQEEMRNAQGDIDRIQQIQQESVKLMSEMTKKQLIPMCIRTIIFFAVFGVLSIFYKDIEFDKNPLPIFGRGFFSLYFLYSIGLSLINFLIRFIIKKLKKQESSTETVIDDPVKALNYKINLSTPLAPQNTSQTPLNIENLSDDLKKVRQNLIEKQKQGLIPNDIDIDSEIKRLQEEENQIKSEQQLKIQNTKENINNDRINVQHWKNKLQNDKKEIDLND
ncbi:MAG: hypothetical protein ACTSRZ_09675 [Promethearchaeota archaeon]